MNLKYEAEKNGRAADARRYQKEADRLAKEQERKAAEAKVIEDAEDEAERQRALNDKRKYESLEKRSIATSLAYKKEQESLKILHEKETKALNEGRASDARKYKEEADRVAKEHAQKAAEAKVIEDAEDEAERQRTLNDKRKYDDLVARTTKEAKAAEEEKEDIKK